LTSDTGAAFIGVTTLAAGQTIKVRTLTGEVDFRLPTTLAADLTAMTQTGRVKFTAADFAATANVVQSRTSVTATLNGGVAPIDRAVMIQVAGRTRLARDRDGSA